jgi:hypothetical protein
MTSRFQNFLSKPKLRRYKQLVAEGDTRVDQVRRCKLAASRPVLKAPLVSALEVTI